MSKKLKAIRKRHQFFKDHFGAKPTWKGELSVAEIDFLLKKIEKLSGKKAKKLKAVDAALI